MQFLTLLEKPKASFILLHEQNRNVAFNMQGNLVLIFSNENKTHLYRLLRPSNFKSLVYQHLEERKNTMTNL